MANFFLFPLKADEDGKYRPLLAKWQHASSNDPNQWAEWQARFKTSAWALDTGKSGLVVVDLDVKHGVDGIESFKNLCKENNAEWVDTYTVRTKSNGLHLYFIGQARCSTSAHNGLGPGIDIRSVGGYVHLPPTKGYLAIDPKKPIALLPEWLEARLLKPREKKPRNDEVEVTTTKDNPADVEWAQQFLDMHTAPTPGNRNDDMFRVACRLRDKGLSKEKATGFLSEYIEKHALEQNATEIVEHAYTYAQNNFAQTSAPTEFNPIPLPETKTKKYKRRDPFETRLVSCDSPYHTNIIQELNEEWAVTTGHAASVIQRLEVNALGFKQYFQYEQAAFKQHLANRMVEIETPTGTKVIPVSKFWLEHPLRRTYTKGTIFDPSETCSADYLNLWQGWAVKPEPGDWSLLKQHIWENVAQKSEADYQYLLYWMAHLFQKPNELPGVAVILKGLKGTGKSILGDMILKIVGAHGQTGSGGRLLTGQFNLSLQACCFCLINELDWAGDKEGNDILKDRITAEHLLIEPKKRETFLVKNFLHVFITSNSDWVVHATPDERRFAVFDVLPTRKGDSEFWSALHKQMQDGGLSAMLHELLALNISDWHPRKNIPWNFALQDQIAASRGPFERSLCDLLEYGIPATWIPQVFTVIPDSWDLDNIPVFCDELVNNIQTLYQRSTQDRVSVWRKLKKLDLVLDTKDRTRDVIGRQRTFWWLRCKNHPAWDPFR